MSSSKRGKAGRRQFIKQAAGAALLGGLSTTRAAGAAVRQ
ncbi:MAG: twin-arginine translocation signal domain-containing protein [Opitutaceae bacterium]